MLAVLFRELSLSRVPNCVVDQSSVQWTKEFWRENMIQNIQHLTILASLEAFKQVLSMSFILVFHCAQ